jgi:predicted transcriptional regulator
MKIKIEIIDRETLHKQEMRDLKENRYQKEDLILSFENWDTFCSTFSTKRVELLRAIKSKKPVSLYALARILGRDYKNVQTDAQMLCTYGLIELKKVHTGKRIALRPISKIDKAELTLAI